MLQQAFCLEWAFQNFSRMKLSGLQPPQMKEKLQLRINISDVANVTW